MQAMAAELDKVQQKHRSMSFKAAAEEYMETKRNVLSPSTVRGYDSLMRQIPEAFCQKNIHDITALDVQADIIRMGGWESDHVMKSVYRHSMMEKEANAKREAAEKLRSSLFS